MHPAVRPMLKRVMLEAPNKAEEAPLFQNSLGGYRRRGDIAHAWEKVRKRADLSDKPRRLRFHDLPYGSFEGGERPRPACRTAGVSPTRDAPDNAGLRPRDPGRGSE